MKNLQHITLLLFVVIDFLCSCNSTRHSQGTISSSYATEYDDISSLADKVWMFGQSHPYGFTLDIRTMTEPTEGIAVSYSASQDSHSRSQLENVVSHAMQHNGYVGGWYNDADSLYYFDSTRLFSEDSLDSAISFGKENGQKSVFILSSREEISVASFPEHSPTVFIVMYDKEIGKEPLLKAVKDSGCEVIYDYNIIPGMALRKPHDKTLEETMLYFKRIKGVLSVEYDRIYHLTDPIKPKLELE